MKLPYRFGVFRYVHDMLDFVNEADGIQRAFQPYFEATLLTEPTGPNKLHDLRRAVEDHHLFGTEEVDDFARVYSTFTRRSRTTPIW